MFGKHEIPVALEQDDIKIELCSSNNCTKYARTSISDTVNKDLFIQKSDFFIEPVEPMYLPEQLTNHLLIEFENSIIIEPKSSIEIYLTFPIEIAAFTKYKKEIKRIDIFSVSKKKYTLYGDPEDGILCKYWKSPIFQNIPEVNPLKEGVLQLKIENQDAELCEIEKAVFNAYGMKIYYDSELVSLIAKMKIRDNFDAETTFYNKSLKPLMMKSQEMFLSAKIAVGGGKFIMEHGL